MIIFKPQTVHSGGGGGGFPFSGKHTGYLIVRLPGVSYAHSHTGQMHITSWVILQVYFMALYYSHLNRCQFKNLRLSLSKNSAKDVNVFGFKRWHKSQVSMVWQGGGETSGRRRLPNTLY